VTALSAPERRRLARLLGLLGSDHAGERDSAACKAQQLVTARGTTWQAVLSVTEPAAVPGYAEGYATGYAAAVAALVPPWRVQRDLALGLPDLSAKERAFLEDIGRWRRLTPRQQDWLEAIFQRVPLPARAAS
jgi:hypothetical protein